MSICRRKPKEGVGPEGKFLIVPGVSLVPLLNLTQKLLRPVCVGKCIALPGVGRAHMPKVISIHEYVLKPGVDAHQFERALHIAQERGLFRLPGLAAYHFVKGIKGTRKGHYTAIWIYESRAAWEALWGSVEHPRSKHEYPENWQVWENEILSPLLTRDPDMIMFTSYEELLSAGQ